MQDKDFVEQTFAHVFVVKDDAARDILDDGIFHWFRAESK
jgi:hypothetical protein